MQIKRYVAKNIQEALRQVKKELGSEALILSVKNIKSNSGPLSLLSTTHVEVTAAIDEVAPPPRYIPESKQPLSNVPAIAADQLARRPFPGFQKVSHGARQISQTLKQTLGSFRDNKAAIHHQPNIDRITSLGHLLKNIGLQEDIIRHITDVLCQEIPNSETPQDSFRMESLARGLLQRLVKTSGPIELGSQKPKYVALVGPTGTGKTTTIAKLSAEMLLKRKRKVGLITIDTYRVGALDQLNAYAGIMNIPVKSASTFEQMRKAIVQYQDQDVVFIDTAGFSHHDLEHLQLLSAFLVQVENPEIHLVISVNTNEKELIHISQNFHLLHYGHLLFTKLDESSYLGTLFNHMIYTGKPISYLTTGQKVPEDIELATPASIVRMMFRKESLVQKEPYYRASVPVPR
jgi:flagellar biosynthesis protein FlhF